MDPGDQDFPNDASAFTPFSVFGMRYSPFLPDGLNLSDQALAVGPHGSPAGTGPVPAEPQPDSEEEATRKLPEIEQEIWGEIVML